MVLEQFKYPGCPVYTLSLLVSYVVTSKGTWHKVLIPQVTGRRAIPPNIPLMAVEGHQHATPHDEHDPHKHVPYPALPSVCQPNKSKSNATKHD
jgi:hypothetical protein